MHVRPAKREDLPAIGDILAACDLLLPGVTYDEWTGWLLVAERAGQVIGMLHVLPGKPVSIITHLGVLPMFRGSRAGYKLTESTELLLRAQGYPGWIAFIDGDQKDWAMTLEKWGAVPSSGTGSIYRRMLG